MALGQSWGMNGWKKAGDSGVTLQEAFGIKKGTIKFPPLQAQLPGQVAQSSQGSKGGSGARGGPAPTPTGADAQKNMQLGQALAAKAGWTEQNGQWQAFDWIANEESGWQTTIHNGGGFGYVPGLAYGIPQALPGSKMASAGADWQTNPATQIKWMIGYIRSTYGTPQNAKAFHLANGWY